MFLDIRSYNIKHDNTDEYKKTPTKKKIKLITPFKISEMSVSKHSEKSEITLQSLKQYLQNKIKNVTIK